MAFLDLLNGFGNLISPPGGGAPDIMTMIAQLGLSDPTKAGELMAQKGTPVPSLPAPSQGLGLGLGITPDLLGGGGGNPLAPPVGSAGFTGSPITQELPTPGAFARAGPGQTLPLEPISLPIAPPLPTANEPGFADPFAPGVPDGPPEGQPLLLPSVEPPEGGGLGEKILKGLSVLQPEETPKPAPAPKAIGPRPGGPGPNPQMLSQLMALLQSGQGVAPQAPSLSQLIAGRR